MNDRVQRVSNSITSAGGIAGDESVLVRRFCLRTAKHLTNLNRERARVFGADAALFHDPAWDILLNLYIAFCEGRRPIRGEATMKDTLPPTTGLRVLANLEERGLVKTETHPTNGRVLLQSLTARGVELMEASLQKMVEPRRRPLLNKA
jgi:hypothetical protein